MSTDISTFQVLQDHKDQQGMMEKMEEMATKDLLETQVIEDHKGLEVDKDLREL